MRVATTTYGKKLHLIDPNTSDLKDTVTTCGRKRIIWVNISRPVKGQVCQTCVRSAFARMQKLLEIPVTMKVLGPGRLGKRKIKPPQSRSQQKLKGGKGAAPLTEGKTKHVKKP